MNTKTFPTLYGRAKTGAVKEWTIRVTRLQMTRLQEEGGPCAVVVTYGQRGGMQQVATKTVKSGKNLGRANATTPWEQACAEAQSTWTKKTEQGYSTEPPGPDAATYLPMLAQKYADKQHTITWPAYIQPKLNGVRCLVRRDGRKVHFMSRGGKTYHNLQVMAPDFLQVMRDGEVWDGEIYCHQEISFQQLISLIKNEKDPDWDAIKRHVRFWWYDVADTAKGFRDRYLRRCESIRGINPHGYIIPVETLTVEDAEDVQVVHRKNLADGYEGSVVRSGSDDGYLFHYRSTQLLKVKDFQEEEFTIVWVKEGVGKDEGAAIFVCRTKAGQMFDVRPAASYEVRWQQWKQREKWIGRPLTVRFQYYSDDGVPIFPVGVIVRDYE